MPKFEAITLTKKKDNRGEITSYSVNVSKREAAACGILDTPVIKIIDEQEGSILIKAKSLTVDDELLQGVIAQKKALEKEDFYRYLCKLSAEMLTDLVMLMYIGQEQDLDMSIAPGVQRFLIYYQEHIKIVSGKSTEELVDILAKKAPLTTYLRIGYDLVFAERG